MTTQAQNNTTPLYKKRWIKVLGALLVFLAALYFSLIFAAKFYFVDWFENNGADKAVIEKLWFNPFTGRVSLGGVNVEAKGKTLLADSEMEIDLGITSLFKKDIRLELAKYDGLLIDLEQFPDGRWRYASYTTEKTQEQQNVETREEVSSSWAFLADKVLLQNSTVRFTTPELALELKIEQAELTKLSTRDGHPAGTFTLKGKLNDRTIEIDLDTLQIVPELKTQGKINVAISLTEVHAYLKDLFPTFAGDVDLQGAVLFTKAEKGDMEAKYDGLIILEKPDVGSPSMQITADTLKWQGDIQFKGPQQGPIQVLTDGTLSAAQYTLQLPEAGLINSEESIELTGKTTVEVGKALKVANEGTFSIAALSLELEDLQVTEKELNWTGKLQYATDQEGTTSMVKLNGDLTGSGLVTELQSQKMTITQEEFTLNSDSTLSFGEEVDIKGENSVALKNFKLKLENEELPLISLGLLNIDKLLGKGGKSIEAEKCLAENFLFHGVIDSDGEKPVLALNSVQLQGFSWSGEQGVAAKQLQFENLATNILIDKEGRVNITQRLAPLTAGDNQQPEENNQPEKEVSLEEPPRTPPEEKKSVEESSMPIRLGKVVFTGNNSITFEDHSLPEPYLTELVVTKFELGELDSSNPENKTSLLLEGEFDKRAPILLKGSVSPFKEKLSLDMNVSLKNYQLASLSAYTVQAVGTALASGQLQLTTELKLADDTLDMKNNVLLKKLKTKKISEELAKELDNELPIPLDSALSILRDSKGDIDLNIPLKGPVSDFSVGISDVLITALSKAIVPAASGYLMYALGPYGALAYVGVKVGENIMQISLPPVKFAPGTITMEENKEDYFERVAKILTDRPETDLQLCPQVASWEFMKDEAIKAITSSEIVVQEKDKKKLDELGQQRAAFIQQFLVEKHSIAKERLLICETVIETKKDTVPSLLLQL